MNNCCVTNALILPMTEKRESFSGYARVRNGAIAEVGAGTPPTTQAGEEMIDGAGCVLMPGLVNAHTHLYQVLLRAVWEDLELMPWLKRIYGCARVLRPEHFYAGSLLGCVEAIRSGVTTVCEHNFLNPSLRSAGSRPYALSKTRVCAPCSRARSWIPGKSCLSARKRNPSRRFAVSKNSWRTTLAASSCNS